MNKRTAEKQFKQWIGEAFCINWDCYITETIKLDEREFRFLAKCCNGGEIEAEALVTEGKLSHMFFINFVLNGKNAIMCGLEKGE